MYKIFKRIFDIVFCLPVVVLLLPLFFVFWVLVRLGSKGPGVFKQTRAGKDGRPFTFYKFRTMRTDADPFGASPKSGDDDRLTKAGRFLREYSLDELPQMFNILKGDMSLVGPRPLYVSQIAEWNEHQKKRLKVKPGLTGLAQISGRGHLTREEKLNFDAEYVERAGFWLDMKIIGLTFLQVFGKKQIYEKRYSQSEYTRNEPNSEK